MGTRFGKSDGFRRVKLVGKRLIGREPRFRLDRRPALKRMGEWRVHLDSLPENGVVYALGVGEDIIFDLELARDHGMEVHAFDPTPNSVQWLEGQDLPDNFHFHPWAVSDQDGSFLLYPRVMKDGSHSSSMYTLIENPRSRDAAVEVPAKTLTTIMAELGHQHIDVLKMDIEGAEYEVLKGLLATSLRPPQLLIEFHHRFKAFSHDDTISAIEALRAEGYALADIAPTGKEFTLLREV